MMPVSATCFSKDALADDQDAIYDITGLVISCAEQGVQPSHQWLHVRRQDAARGDVGQQVLHREQCMNFSGRACAKNVTYWGCWRVV